MLPSVRALLHDLAQQPRLAIGLLVALITAAAGSPPRRSPPRQAPSSPRSPQTTLTRPRPPPPPYAAVRALDLSDAAVAQSSTAFGGVAERAVRSAAPSSDWGRHVHAHAPRPTPGGRSTSARRTASSRWWCAIARITRSASDGFDVLVDARRAPSTCASARRIRRSRSPAARAGAATAHPPAGREPHPHAVRVYGVAA